MSSSSASACWRQQHVVRNYLSQIFTTPAYSSTTTTRRIPYSNVKSSGLVYSKTSRRTFTSTCIHRSAPPRVKKEPMLPGAAGFETVHKLPIIESSPLGALLRRNDPHRTGVLAFKRGMTAIYDDKGKRLACTILQLDRVQVTSVKTWQKHGYWAVQVGCGWRQPGNISRPMLGHYAACEVSPKQHLMEFRVKDEKGLIEPGTMLKANWFVEGQCVDVRAKSKGKGFAGGMKRHGWAGQPASHGNSLSHRAMGSAGQSQGGGSRVLPGKRMAGRMGGHRVTTQAVKILKVDPDLNIVVIKGNVAGPNGCLVTLQDAIWSPPVKADIDISIMDGYKTAAAIPATA